MQTEELLEYVVVAAVVVGAGIWFVRRMIRLVRELRAASRNQAACSGTCAGCSGSEEKKEGDLQNVDVET